MPICPRCGKCLSSEQALTYHLNRKYRCGIWNCIKCEEKFNTKFQLSIHELSCIGDRRVAGTTSDITYPSTNTLYQVYQVLPFVLLEIDDRTNTIITASPKCQDILGIHHHNVIGKQLGSIDMGTHQIEYIKRNLICISGTNQPVLV